MRKFWKHEHKPWREHAPSCWSPVTGQAIRPVAFRWCKCGEEIDMRRDLTSALVV